MHVNPWQDEPGPIYQGQAYVYREVETQRSTPPAARVTLFPRCQAVTSSSACRRTIKRTHAPQEASEGRGSGERRIPGSQGREQDRRSHMMD